MFDISFERVTPRDAPLNGVSAVAHHQRLAWGSLAYAVDVALTHHAEWIFRVRFDAHIAQWRVPPPGRWAPDCVYGFQQAWGWPSDNALLFPARAGPHIFNASRTGPLGEPAVLDGAREAGLRFCWMHVDVWLLKPELRVLKPAESRGSTGVRRWTSPPSLQANDSQPAAGYNHTKFAHRRRALHSAWATYARAPLPRELTD